MQTHIQKWGNSLALRIPKAFADEIGLDVNTPVEIKLENNQLVIMPAQKPAYDLDDLVAQITDENQHGETDTGAVVGREIW